RATALDASPDGTLVLGIPERERRELVWVSQTGTIAAIPGSRFESSRPSIALSPDGKRAALSVRMPDGRDEFVVRDLATATDTRLALPLPSSGMLTAALVTWAPTGRLLYAAGGVEASKIYDWPADGSANGHELVTGYAARMMPSARELIVVQDVRSH